MSEGSDFMDSKNLLWFKDAIIYELHIRSFKDSTDNGIGDFRGAISKLDYLEELGVNTIWLQPFYPSPMKDDGYDVTDYSGIHSEYGSLTDFKDFLKETHKRDMRVIIDLVLNHTSDQHPMFQLARSSRKNSRQRNFYIWNDAPNKYKDARILYGEHESSNWSYDEKAKSYYFHRFYKHQPDLNYNNPEVQVEMFKIVDFWLKLGVDGFRLSAVPYLFKKEGTSCENLPETHDFLKKLRKYIKRRRKDVILMAEANVWPEEASEYFGKSDECEMAFNYPLMTRLFMAIHTENSYPIVDILEQTPVGPDNTQWAVFLRNHDEIALDTVTEEEKDYLKKAYAKDPRTRKSLGIRRRLAPMLENDRRKIELMYVLLLSVPGSPIIYYGDEIGMGDNIYLGGRDGVRTPMQWTPDSNAGFSSSNPQELYLPVVSDPVYRHETVNVYSQLGNPASVFNWIKNILRTRKNIKAFGRGDIVFIESSSPKVLAFTRNYEGKSVLVVVNLSRFAQPTFLDLQSFSGHEPVEIFSQNAFPQISDENYSLTIGPYGYYWFTLEKTEAEINKSDKESLPEIVANISWEKLLQDFSQKTNFERKVLPKYIMKTRWFGGKAKAISNVSVDTQIPVKVGKEVFFILILEVSYLQSVPEYYNLPVAFVADGDISDGVEYTAQSILCRATLNGVKGMITDGLFSKSLRDHIYLSISKQKAVEISGGASFNFLGSHFRRIKVKPDNIDSFILKAEQSNTSVIYDKKYFFKIYRKIEKEINPDLELVRFLTEKADFKNAPQFAGGMEYRTSDKQSVILGLLQEMVDNQGDAWEMSMDSIGQYYDQVFAKVKRTDMPPPLVEDWTLSYEEIPELLQELIGRVTYERMRLLGQRTAEMHLALASDNKNPDFAPEPFNPNYQRALYSSFRHLVSERFGLLEKNIRKMPKQDRKLSKQLLKQKDIIMKMFSDIYKNKLVADRTRIHGDYHLGQVLFTGKDFIIIDFEGEPGVSFSERRFKKGPLKDVAGMLRSFHYASYGKIALSGIYNEKEVSFLEPWAEQWQHYILRFYLKAYYETKYGTDKISENDITLLKIYVLEKAVYELGYELNSRLDWVKIPLKGIEYLLNRYTDKK